MTRIQLLFSKIWQPRIVFLGSIFIFVLLLAKNPLSERTLIPNFEPFPDTFYYVTTARCTLAGKGWTLCRPESADAAGISSSVAPLYSATLIPGFILFNDPRFFYATNVLIALTSLGIFYLLAKRVTMNAIFLALLLGLYVTNFYLYWFPTLAMAENLLLLLALSGVYFATSRPSKINSGALAVISVGIALTKFSAIIYGAGFFGLGLIQYFSNVDKKSLKKHIVFLVLLISTLSSIFYTRLMGFALVALDLFSNPSQTSWFSSYYFPQNSFFYLSAVFGQVTTVLWHSLPLVDPWLAVGALIGGLLGFSRAKTKTIVIFSVLPLIFHVLFMSFFYVADARYIIFAIPLVLLLFGIYLERTHELFLKKSGEWVFYGILGIVTALILVSILPRIKSQVSLNLRYAETPWWYIAVKEMNTFFELQKSGNTHSPTPTVITLISPYFIDFYSNQTYSVLPLDTQQDFRGHKHAVWGSHVNDDLHQVYSSYLAEDEDLYISNYGTAGSTAFRESFEEIEKAFTLTKVQEGCHNLCNIYKVSEKSTQAE